MPNTEWMVKTGLKPWAPGGRRLCQRLAACPDEKIKTYLIREAVLRPWCLPEIARHLDRTQDQPFFSMYDQARITFGAEVSKSDPR